MSSDSEADLQRDIRRLSRDVSKLRKQFDQKQLAIHGEHLRRGMDEQNRAFLELAAKAHVDPRASVRVALAPDGRFVTVAAREENVMDLFAAIRHGPQELAIVFEASPNLDGPQVLPPGDEPAPALPSPRRPHGPRTHWATGPDGHTVPSDSLSSPSEGAPGE